MNISKYFELFLCVIWFISEGNGLELKENGIIPKVNGIFKKKIKRIQTTKLNSLLKTNDAYSDGYYDSFDPYFEIYSKIFKKKPSSSQENVKIV